MDHHDVDNRDGQPCGPLLKKPSKKLIESITAFGKAHIGLESAREVYTKKYWFYL